MNVMKALWLVVIRCEKSFNPKLVNFFGPTLPQNYHLAYF
jgi:hypothetical protein